MCVESTGYQDKNVQSQDRHKIFTKPREKKKVSCLSDSQIFVIAMCTVHNIFLHSFSHGPLLNEELMSYWYFGEGIMGHVIPNPDLDISPARRKQT